SNAFSAPSGVGLYNPWSPAISQGDFYTLAPNATASTTVTVNSAEWAHTPALGVMVVSTDNASGASEAATLPVTLKEKRAANGVVTEKRPPSGGRCFEYSRLRQ